MTLPIASSFDSSLWTSQIAEHKSVFSLLEDKSFISQVEQAISLISMSLSNGGKILVAGNGGSAADAQHLATELVCRFEKNRKSLPAIALTTDTSMLTAIGNDFSFDEIFSRQIEGLGNEGDVFIGFSTSGNSQNIVRAVEQAKSQGLKTVVFCGEGGKLKDISDVAICVPHTRTARIQEVHLFVYHYICLHIESGMKDESVEAKNSMEDI